MEPRLAALDDLVLHERARKLLSRPMRHVHHEDFDSAGEAESAFWLGPMPEHDAYWAKKARMRPPSSADPQIREHYLWPLLTAQQEVHLFRQMNFLKFRAQALRDRLAAGDLSVLDEVGKAHARVDLVRNHLFSANRRIAVGIAKRFAFRQKKDFWDTLADGDVSLLAAVENFNFGFGFKFSTYAYWSILRNYTRNIPKKERKYKSNVPYEEDAAFPAPESEDDRPGRKEEADLASEAVEELLAYLEPRERTIIRLRNGIGTGRFPMTLADVGSQLGITKERTRQVECAARYKLFVLARNLKLKVP